MSSKYQWSVRRMFLWVFVAALVFSHLASFYQSRIVGFIDFTISDQEIDQWLVSLDSSAQMHSGGGGSTSGGNSVESEMDFLFSTDTAMSDQVMAHLAKCIRTRAETGGWDIPFSSEGSDSLSFSITNAATRFRIYCWNIPLEDLSYAEMLKRDGKQVFRLKFIQVGYQAK